MPEVAVETLPLEAAWMEWQAGVFRADRPAERAMCRGGVGGSARSVWWVVVKRVFRCG